MSLRYMDNMNAFKFHSQFSVIQRMAPEMAAVERLGGYDLKVCIIKL